MLGLLKRHSSHLDFPFGPFRTTEGPQSHRNCGPFASLFGLFQACFQPQNRVNKIQSADSLYFKNFAQNRIFET